MDMLIIGFFVVVAVLMYAGVKIVPQQQVWILERFGKFSRQLEAGLHVIIPFMDIIAYKHTLKERAIDVMEQTAITKDNVTLHIDGIIYVRIMNPRDASYGVENPYYAVTQLAQTSMRSAIGKIPLDKTFEERETLNAQIVQTINEAAINWGIQCMRYEIRDIKPPMTVLQAMELQVAADRQKRADILQSEGKQQSVINLAEASKREFVLNSEGKKQSVINLAEAAKQETVLNSEGDMTQQINKAKGEAEAITLVAEATARGINMVGESLQKAGGSEAVSLKIAEQYIDAFKALAKTNNTILLPANANDTGSMVAQALSIFNQIKAGTTK
jgi:regulator of protease activity HflC (stomatin/prohibitin superfamily)